MEHEKYSYAEALRWLANKYNVEIEEKEVSPEVKLQQQAAESLHIINTFAQKYFTDILFNNDQGRDIGLSYLKERGFREEIIDQFQLGYCLPERDTFARTAIQAQYNLEFLQKSGLVGVRDEKPYDNYRGRIIFPVHNQSGKIAGFGARIIGKNDKAPKYINTPENDIYVKSKILYGLYFARQAIDKNDECLLVEGYTDVVSLHQAGINNVVASGGTSLTIDQLRLVRKFTHNLTIIYDGDSAGVKASLRGLDLALEESLNVRLVLIPDKEDPDSYVNKIGPAAFREFIASNKKDFILFQLEVYLQEAGNDTARKSEVVNTMAETIARINKAEDFTRRQDYIRQSAALMKIDETGLNNLVNKYIREKIAKQENRNADDTALRLSQQPEYIPEDTDILSLLQRDEIHEKALVRCLLEFGLKEWDDQKRVSDYLIEEIEHHLVDDVSLIDIIHKYKEWYDEGIEPTPKNFLYHEDQAMSAQVVALMDFPYELSGNWKDHFEGKIFTREELYREEINSTVNYLKLRKIKRMIEDNQKDLENIESVTEQMVVIKTHQRLKQMEMELLKNIGTVILR